jgi:radical SAM superfamily enzyme YgiQ (UPF0313 family)
MQNTKKKKYKLFLINPKIKYHHYGVQKELCNLLGKKIFNFSTALPLIAALTPDNYKIKIIDESIEEIPKNERPDLVGLTTFTTTKKRCYEIADYYRSLNIPVIIGGAHASFASDEVLKHADSIIIGEAELIWKKCLSDFENGKLKKTYKAENLCDFKNSPIPRWDLTKHKKINIIGVQASRGCPFNCEFCLVEKMFGKKHRVRDVDDVIKEIKSLPTKRIFFVDDNLTFNKKFIRALIEKLKPLDVSWACQASIEIGDNIELLKEMAASGCLSILIGFESLNPESIKETHKHQNKIEDYEKKIKNIHDAGIYVTASFAVGFDPDKLDMYDRIVEFTTNNNLIFSNIFFLLPAPGTDLTKRMRESNRLIDIDPDFFNANFPGMKYKNFKSLEMYDKYFESICNIFSIKTMGKKAINLLESGTFKNAATKDVKLIEKILMTPKIIKKYYFSKNEEKKELFKKLFLIGRNKIASWDHVAYLALAILGFDEYMNNYKKMYPKLREEVAKFDNLN